MDQRRDRKQGGSLPSVSPTCSDVPSLGVAAGPHWRGEQPCPRAGASWVWGRTGSQKGNKQPQVQGTGFIWDHLRHWQLEMSGARSPAPLVAPSHQEP